MAHFHHFSMVNQTQSISHLVMFRQNTKAIPLLFGHKWLIFITCQCSIKIIQFHIWSCLGKIPRLYPYCLATNGSFSKITCQCSINHSISHLIIFRQNTKAIALLFGQKWLIFITFQCSININPFQIWSFFGKVPRL